MKRIKNIANLTRWGIAALCLTWFCCAMASAQDAAEKERFKRALEIKVREAGAAAEEAAKAVEAEAKAVKAVKAAEELKKAAEKKAAETPVEVRPIATEDPGIAYERTLAAAKIEPTAAGLRSYLVALHPNRDTKQQLQTLIGELGGDDFAQREAAMFELRQRSAIAIESLQAATESPNPEVRWRASKLLANAANEADSLFFAIFKLIELREHKGLAAPLLLTMPLCHKEHVRFAARRAMIATVTPEDNPLLRQELQNADPQVRIVALAALQHLSPEDATKEAFDLLEDREPRVRMAAARLLAQGGDRAALPILVALLDAEEMEVRSDASRTLKAISGHDFGFMAYDREADRTAARDKWKAWLATDGQSAKLLLPLKDQPFELGRILLCSYGSSKVYEFDVDAKDPERPRWVVQMGMQPWAVQGLPNGHRLVAYYGGRKIVEFGPEKDASKPIWESEMLPGGPMGMHRLENGNTVVACTDGEVVVELDSQGKILKKWPLTGRPVDVERLENGNTLVTLQNGHKIVEVDGEGNEVWSTKVALQNPFSAQRLENGNTLVAVLSMQKVVEINRAGDREEWALDGLQNPYHAQRLTNGNTLVVETTGICEYDTHKKPVWKLAIPHVSRASRF